ncbi:helix-turn-helix domain-containing protein [Actinacidiphila acidipaludis]|uniref:Helix-turn-helix domain-containing protein n=1 Tax=Actinacidiphila acidipaludis TaxID=2873382 RepID=A0ABS7Q822_9ACTN|nr:helix-turn-helix transcriptional regulator [Streptomyces acidipaludis]MBY8879311.1 helix-turn-helix domain-containing protein [Streptomyces acidipaludis]
MAPTPRELKPAHSARDLFGAEQRRLRVAAGLSLDRLAEIVNYSKSHLHGVEIGERLPLPPLPEKLDATFGTGQLFVGLWEIAKRERTPKRFDHCLELEARATRVQVYASSLIPGLLQTEAYMRAQFAVGEPDLSSDDIEIEVAKRLSRQERLRGDNPPDLWAVVDESALRRTSGGPEIMRDQLAALLAFVDTAHTTIQVMPFSQSGYPITNGTVILLTLPDRSTAVYAESSAAGEIIEDRKAIARTIRHYDRMKACALSPGASARVIEAVLEVHERCEQPPPS